MPQVTLTYTFNLPEDQQEFNVLVHSDDIYCAIDEAKRFIHARLKYHDTPESEVTLLEQIREMLYVEGVGLD